jgi:hypothetical protein
MRLPAGTGGPGIVPVIGELIPSGVSEHVRMDRE